MATAKKKAASGKTKTMKSARAKKAFPGLKSRGVRNGEAIRRNGRKNGKIIGQQRYSKPIGPTKKGGLKGASSGGSSSRTSES